MISRIISARALFSSRLSVMTPEKLIGLWPDSISPRISFRSFVHIDRNTLSNSSRCISISLRAKPANSSHIGQPRVEVAHYPAALAAGPWETCGLRNPTCFSASCTSGNTFRFAPPSRGTLHLNNEPEQRVGFSFG